MARAQGVKDRSKILRNSDYVQLLIIVNFVLYVLIVVLLLK